MTDPGEDRSVFGVLLATRAVAPFRGRAADRAWLDRWCADPGAHPVAVVTGPAGAGKTRLVTQFASDRPEPWAAGWLHPGCGAVALAAVRACGDPALILVDDADERPDLKALLEELAASPDGSPVRIVLITRAPDMSAATGGLEPQYRSVLDNAPELPVGPFGSGEDHARWFDEAVRAYAAARRTPPPDLPAYTSRRPAGAADEPILALQAQALLAVLDSERARPMAARARALPFDEVAAALFAYEQHRWNQAAAQPERGVTGLTQVVQDRAVAALLLTGAASEAQAVAALRDVPDLEDAPGERLANIARWAAHLYPGESPWPIRIRPGMLAEWFLVTQLTRTPELARNLADLGAAQKAALLAVLAHASDHMPQAARLFADLIATSTTELAAAGAAAALTARAGQPHLDAALAALIAQASWTAETLAALDRQLPGGLLPRTRVAVTTAQVANFRDNGTSEELASTLQGLGAHLQVLGRHQEALAAAQEALALYRTLASSNPAHQPDLASTLQGLGAHLRDLGRHQEALAADEEALALYRALAASNPAHQPSLAETLHSYGIALRDLGRYQEALAAAKEALALCRALAASNPAHQPGLAETLHSYGIALRDPGRYQEALAAAKEALALYRALAASNPAHQPGLARTLHSYGIALSDLGRYQEALAAAEEAVALWRTLAASNPAHQPGLAMTLQGYGLGLRDLGRYQEALAANEEALSLWRTLAASNPAHQPSLANTLHSHGLHLRDMGRHQEALAADEQAVDIYGVLASTDPDHYEDTYKRALAELRRALELAGDHEASTRLHLGRQRATDEPPPGSRPIPHPGAP